eukprot:1108537-Rhodomonas_salina.2
MSSDSESDHESEDEEYTGHEQHESTEHIIKPVVTNTGPYALLHLLVWMMVIALHLLNTACIKILSWDL